MLTENQKAICAKFNSQPIESEPELKCGLAIKTLGFMPIYGVRHAKCSGTTGWYIWCGEYSDDPNFFDPLHTSHLEDCLPLVLPYLALAPGFSFVIDKAGYEDVWFDAAKAGKA